MSIWQTIADDASAESELWAAALLPRQERRLEPVFSTLGDPRHWLAIETIYEGYLIHYGRPRLFRRPDRDTALLLGDYLYAHGLVRVSVLGEPTAVADLAELISLCAHLRAEDAPGDGAAWAATAAQLGRGVLEEARLALRDGGDAEPLLALAGPRPAVAPALAAHAVRVT
jgi:hypothetical protein